MYGGGASIRRPARNAPVGPTTPVTYLTQAVIPAASMGRIATAPMNSSWEGSGEPEGRVGAARRVW